MGLLYQCQFEVKDKSELQKEIQAQDEEATLPEEDWFGNCFLLAYNYDHAMQEAKIFLDKSIGKDNWELIALGQYEGIVIANSMTGEEGDCGCPYCAVTSDTPADDIFIFNCPECNETLRIISDGWDEINCIECGFTLKRENIILENGKFVYKKDE